MKEAEKTFRKLCEGMLGQAIADEGTYTQISNPIRFGGLAINTTRLAEETKEIFDRGNVTTNDLKEKLVNQDQSLPAKYDHTEYRKEVEREIGKE